MHEPAQTLHNLCAQDATNHHLPATTHLFARCGTARRLLILVLASSSCHNRQGIYGFRGSDPAHLTDADKDFPNLATIFLKDNYRYVRSASQFVAALRIGEFRRSAAPSYFCNPLRRAAIFLRVNHMSVGDMEVLGFFGIMTATKRDRNQA